MRAQEAHALYFGLPPDSRFLRCSLRRVYAIWKVFRTTLHFFSTVTRLLSAIKRGKLKVKCRTDVSLNLKFSPIGSFSQEERDMEGVASSRW
ncbi:hypothetical protein RUM43_001790 [Polyplax serrata]|uniref:Uncharacterized protein n=1 Tax=Polyplax serrata TaxID=468196 RepID=A0AAN8SEE9_POLSC